MLDPQIGCTIITYNEERRIATAIRHAKKWCGHIVVIDKGSTDHTKEIATREGARILGIDYTEQGEEDRTEIQSRLIECYSDFPEWYLGLTAGDSVTNGLLMAIKTRLRSDPVFDVGLVVTRYYSFGDYDEDNPWRTILCPKLFNRKRTVFSVGHHDFTRDNKIVVEIGRKSDAFLLHQTHSSVDDFLSSHIGYARYEGVKGIGASYYETGKSILGLLFRLRKRNVSRLQVTGMITYRLMKLMFRIEAARGRDVPKEYEERVQRLEF